MNTVKFTVNFLDDMNGVTKAQQCLARYQGLVYRASQECSIDRNRTSIKLIIECAPAFISIFHKEVYGIGVELTKEFLFIRTISNKRVIGMYLDKQECESLVPVDLLARSEFIYANVDINEISLTHSNFARRTKFQDNLISMLDKKEGWMPVVSTKMWKTTK